MRRGQGTALVGTIEVPGDKSISHRALVLGAIASRTSSIVGLNGGEDVAATRRCLEALGARIAGDETKVVVESEGWSKLHEADDVLDAGNSGTTLRSLLAVTAAVPGAFTLTGDATLRRRPMLRVVGPLRQMGAAIDGRSHGDRAPLFVRGGKLEGIDFESPVPSAQVKSAVLLAGLAASGTTSVVEPLLSRDHTERMLEAAGVAVERSGLEVSLRGGQQVEAREWAVPGDFSAAAFLIVAALLTPGSELTIDNVGLNPTRTGLLETLREMGADIDVSERGGVEPAGSVTVRSSELRGVDVPPERIPSMVDELPILAVAATQAHGDTRIAGAAELRVKESDRIAATKDGLRALRASVEELRDGLVISGPARLEAAEVESRGDHRIALALAVAGIVSGQNVKVRGWSSVNTSFPEFLDVLGRARRRR